MQLRMVKRHIAPVPDRRPVRMPIPARGTVVRGRFVSKGSRYAQRVMVKVKYRAAHNGKASFRRSLRDNAKYITRDGELKGIDQDGRVVSRDDINDATFGWSEDNRYYKFIFSPEEGHRLDLEKYAAEVLTKVGGDLLTEDEIRRGAKLEWVVVQHHDTDHPHVHVMMRGRIEDRHLRLSNGYVAHGLRSRAREVATQHLGYRAEKGINLEEKRSAVRKRRAELGLDRQTGMPVKQQEQQRGKHRGID
jgi:type IV secretory pathway VirD2 relaxase